MKKHVLISLLVGLSLQAETIYVNQINKAESTDGKTWKSAYKNLNKALKEARNGDDIWVAKGEYILKPTRLNGVNIYGGFTGKESELRQREIVNNETKIFGRLSLQNALISSVTMLEEPEQRRVVEIRFGEKTQDFQPNKKKMREQRNRREQASKQWDKEHPDTKAREVETEVLNEQEQRFQNDRRPERRTGARKGPPRPEEIMQKFDTNSDGKISKEEAPNRMLRDWDRLDINRDGFVEELEIKPPHRRNGEQRPPR